MDENIKYTAKMLKKKYCVWGSFYTLQYPDPDCLHSIFSEKRKVELEEMLQIETGAPIGMAWGKDE